MSSPFKNVQINLLAVLITSHCQSLFDTQLSSFYQNYAMEESFKESESYTVYFLFQLKSFFLAPQIYIYVEIQTSDYIRSN